MSFYSDLNWMPQPYQQAREQVGNPVRPVGRIDLPEKFHAVRRADGQKLCAVLLRFHPQKPILNDGAAFQFR